MAELDFEREAKLMSRVADSMAALPKVAVPRPVQATPTVLVMTWLPGGTLLDGIEQLVSQARRRASIPRPSFR